MAKHRPAACPVDGRRAVQRLGDGAQPRITQQHHQPDPVPCVHHDQHPPCPDRAVHIQPQPDQRQSLRQQAAFGLGHHLPQVPHGDRRRQHGHGHQHQRQRHPRPPARHPERHEQPKRHLHRQNQQRETQAAQQRIVKRPRPQNLPEPVRPDPDKDIAAKGVVQRVKTHLRQRHDPGKGQHQQSRSQIGQRPPDFASPCHAPAPSRCPATMRPVAGLRQIRRADRACPPLRAGPARNRTATATAPVPRGPVRKAQPARP